MRQSGRFKLPRPAARLLAIGIRELRLFEDEIQQTPADFPVTEFWRVLDGSAPGRTHDAQLTIFDSVGFALEDYAALNFVRDAALELGIGEAIDLVPRQADPEEPVRCAQVMTVGLSRPVRARSPVKASAASISGCSAACVSMPWRVASGSKRSR